MNMLAAMLYGPEDVRLVQAPVPEPGPGEIRIRVRAATTCGTDVKVWRRGGHPNMIRPPAFFGHEFAGVIDALGVGVDGWAVGDLVVAANSAPCGRCFFCERSLFSQCEDLLYMNGGYAEYAVIPSRIVEKNLLRVPATLPMEHAALVEPLACVIHGVRDCDIQPREEVAIIGDGPIALFFTCLAAYRSARVTVIGKNPERMKTAERLGAARLLTGRAEDPYVQQEARSGVCGGRGFDVVIECVGTPDTWTAATALARKRGRVNLFGGCAAGTEITIPTSRIHYDELTIFGSYHHDPSCVREALQLLAEGVVPAQEFVSDRAPLTKLPELMRELANGLGVIKVAIVPGDV